MLEPVSLVGVTWCSADGTRLTIKIFTFPAGDEELASHIYNWMWTYQHENFLLAWARHFNSH